ncbi:MAG: hypothetical protein ACI4XM_03150 [Candidatus Coprovivens sp.]
MIHVENGIIELKGSKLTIGQDLLNLEKLVNSNKELKEDYKLAKKVDNIFESIFKDLLSM